jgi:hypothetical protein
MARNRRLLEQVLERPESHERRLVKHAPDMRRRPRPSLCADAELRARRVAEEGSSRDVSDRDAVEEEAGSCRRSRSSGSSFAVPRAVQRVRHARLPQPAGL